MIRISDRIDVDHLPTCLAWPLQGIDAEHHPVIKLWRVCEAAEFLLRFCVAIGAASLREHRLERALERLGERITRPTLGQWLEMARSLPGNLPAEVLVPELASSIRDVIAPLFTQGKNEISAEVLPLRNLLAHGMGMSHELAGELLQGHCNRLLSALQTLTWLTDVRLLSFDESHAPVWLEGATPGLPTQPPEDLPPLPSSRSGEVFLVRAKTALSLWPLLAYVRPGVTPLGQARARSGPRPVMSVYSRLDRDRLHLSVQGSSLPITELQADAVKTLVSWFRLDKLNGPDPHFEHEFEEEAKQFAARRDAIKGVLEVVERAEKPVMWLHGPPGMGKSALAAKVATLLSQEQLPTRRVIAYRFRAGDPRSTRVNFLRHAVAWLERWKQLGAKRQHVVEEEAALESRMDELLVRVSPALRVVFILDGIDEIARVDPGFPQLPFQHRHPGVVWLCVGRQEGATSVFTREDCLKVFPGDGLAPLSLEDVGEWLKLEAPPSQRALIVQAEREGQPAEWVEEVVRSSGGLPLYISYLLEDLRTGEKQVGSALPQKLEEYFSVLMHRGGVDDPAAALPVLLALLALAVESPDAETLEELLRRAGHLRPEAREAHPAIVQDALARARNMIKTISRAGDTSNLFPADEETYLLYHDELRAFLERNAGLANALAAARSGWIALAEQPKGDSVNAKYQGFRSGIRQLLKLGEVERAARLLTDFRYYIGRSEDLRLGLLLDDLGQVLARTSSKTLYEWQRFFRGKGHILERGGQMSFLQQTLADSDSSPITAAAEQYLRDHPVPKRWLRPLGRPPETPRSACLRTMDEHASVVCGLSVDFARGRIVTSDRGGMVWVWALETGLLLHRLGELGPPVDVVSLDVPNNTVLSGNWKGLLSLWDLDSGRPRHSWQAHKGKITAGSLLPGNRVLSAGSDGLVKLWDYAGKCLLTVKAARKGVRAAKVWRGDKVIVESEEQVVSVWDLREGTRLGFINDTSEYGPITAFALSPDGRTLARSSLLSHWSYDLDTGERQEFTSRFTQIRTAAFSGLGDRLLTGGQDGRLGLWDARHGTLLRAFQAHTGWVAQVALSPDGTLGISTGSDRELKIWDLQAEQAEPVENATVERVGRLQQGQAFSFVGKERIDIWDPRHGRRIRSFATADGVAALHPDGQHFVIWTFGGHLEVLDSASGQEKSSVHLASKPRAPWVLEVEPDGQRVLSAGVQESVVRRHRIDTGHCIRTYRGHEGPIEAIAISPLGSFMLTGSDDRTIRLWELKTGLCLRVLKGHSSGVSRIAFLPNGLNAISGDDKGEVRIWNLQTHKSANLKGHQAGVTALAVRSDGKLVASAGAERTLFLWDLRSEYPFAAWAHDKNIASCAFVGDSILIVGDKAGNTRFLELVAPGQGSE